MRLRLDEDGIKTTIEDEIGKPLTGCLQCSKCGGGCMRIEEFDLTPRQVIESLLDCQDQKVLDSRTIWVCGEHCQACQIICPVDIPLNEVMAVLRREASKSGIEPKYEQPSLVYRKYDHCAKHRREGEAGESIFRGETQLS